MKKIITESERVLVARAIGIPLEMTNGEDIFAQSFNADDIVAKADELDDVAFVILKGSLREVVKSANRSITLARYEQGALVGETACLQSIQQRDVSILAADQCILAIIPGEFLRKAAGDFRGDDGLTAGGQNKALQRLEALSSTGAEIAALLQEAGELFTQEIAPGEILFEEGDTADFACIVLSGRFEALQWDQGVAKVLGASGPGTFVGELGVLDNKPRAATVRALEKSIVLILSTELTRTICSVTGVAALTSALRAGYALSGRGIAYSVLVPGSEEDQVVTTIQLPDARTITVTRALASEMVIARGSAEPETKILSPDGRSRIGITNGVPVLVEGRQDWGDLPSVMECLLSEKALEPWRQAAFEADGVLLFAQETDLASNTIVCACTGINAAEVQSHAGTGATTLEDIERICGAGGVCGGCRNRLSKLLGKENFTLCRTTVSPLCEGAVRLRLEPIGCKLPDISAGQYVSIEGLIEGAWVSRSYTVVEASADMIECGVKIEPHGLFSNWLAAYEHSPLVRVSEPQGVPLPEEGNPLLCLVAGIGVTPAVAALRAVADRRPVHVAYIYRGRGAAPYLEELEMAADRKLITISVCDTKIDGRPNLLPFIETIISESSASEALVCGPVAWASNVTKLLRDKGITVRNEVFVHAGSANSPEMVCPGEWRNSTKPFKSPTWRQFTIAEPGAPEAEAKSFLEQFFTENEAIGGFESRWHEVEDEIQQTGTYRQTIEELTFGAKLGWRNAARCIGRLYWSGLKVRDRRHLTHPDDIATALFEHLDLAYNDGNLNPLMTVFDPGTRDQSAVRIWNPQLMRYAGYRKSTGEVVGDPAQLGLTNSIKALGWRGAGGAFDILPIVIEVAGQNPRYYEIPSERRHEVRIRHPKIPGIEDLGLKWFAVPAVSDMALDCGGILYRCAPFNGWYMATEIGARNFTDVDRYNLSLKIAEKVGLDTSRESTLWRDKALTAMTEAVLWSFEADGVKIVDHYNSSLEFLQFCKNEQDASREVCGHWSWLVPPIGGSATPLFLDEWNESEIKPALVMQEPYYFEDND